MFLLILEFQNSIQKFENLFKLLFEKSLKTANEKQTIQFVI